MKNTGLIDLHDIEVLVNRYKAGERNLTVIPSQKEDKPPTVSSLPKNTSAQDKTKSSINYQSEDNSNKTINIIDQSQNIKVDAEIDLNKSENETNKEDKKAQPQITSDLERIMFELHLQEIAENLVNPSTKALSPALQPNLQMLKKYKSNN